MKILIAEDTHISRRLLESLLRKWGHQVLSATTGSEAYDLLRSDPAIHLAIIDWMMPEMDGIELCRRVRALERETRVYIIMLTARTEKDDVVSGLYSGADDYIAKPFNHAELRSRIEVGARTVTLQLVLAQKVAELHEALARVRRLEGLLPICMHCKRIRDRQQHWHRLESYISERTDATFSHGICETCLNEKYPAEVHGT